MSFLDLVHIFIKKKSEQQKQRLKTPVDAIKSKTIYNGRIPIT